MSKVKTIAIIATLDTKGEEAKYFKERIEKSGYKTLVIDTGMRGTPMFEPDITRGEVSEAAGCTIKEIEKLGRGHAEDLMVKGITIKLKELYDAGKFDGVISMGGSDGSTIATAGMKALPLGVPKLMVTPFLKHGEEFSGTRDVILLHSVTDVSGVNPISKRVFDNAIAAIVGMVEAEVKPELEEKNLIAASMFGNTTPCVMKAKSLLEKMGYLVIIFSPNIGTRAMEELIEEGYFAGVLDVTTQDITDRLLGCGLYPAGPHRLEAAGKAGVPQVVVPGCVDFIHWGPPDTLPPRYKGRKIYRFSPLYTLVRVSKEEMITIGKIFSDKLNKAIGPTAVVIPTRGMSMYNKEGEALYDPEADKAFTEALKTNLKPHIKVVEIDAHINDPRFAEVCVSILLEMLNNLD